MDYPSSLKTKLFLFNQIPQVSYSPDVGRYLVAARDIKPLELVIWDAADAMGPCADSVPVCLECFAKVDGSFQCPKCQVSGPISPRGSVLFKSHYQCMFTRFQFPLCGPKCVDKKLHKAECDIFAKIEKKINFSNLTEKHPVYTTIAPLRQGSSLRCSFLSPFGQFPLSLQIFGIRQ